MTSHQCANAYTENATHTDDADQTCGKCKSIWYCSKDCQTADWPVHKLVCSSFAGLDDRPSQKHRLVFHFPRNTRKPELCWIAVGEKLIKTPPFGGMRHKEILNVYAGLELLGLGCRLQTGQYSEKTRPETLVTSIDPDFIMSKFPVFYCYHPNNLSLPMSSAVSALLGADAG